jgi:hypothetical protein
MMWTVSLPPTQPRLPRAYQRGSSILPTSSLFNALVLLLMLVLAVMAEMFYAEGNSGICAAFIVAVGALAFGLWHLNRRKGV